MERITDLDYACKIMGKNIIGPNELEKVNKIELLLNSKFFSSETVKNVPFSSDLLFKNKDSHLLVLIIPEYHNSVKLKFEHFRDHFGSDPDLKEPCFYNQDWYVNEEFYKSSTLELKWVLVQKRISEKTRGLDPIKFRDENVSLMSALTSTYIFFINYILKKEVLWENDYIWCSDMDSNNDQIYVGRYFDSKKINKNGFSIHRHLKIKNNYGVSNIIQ
jgi:hypothetical protein